MADRIPEPPDALGSHSLGVLLRRHRDGTFREILEDWKWILQYTRRYRWAVLMYLVLGLLSASLSILSAVAGKYTIDIITGYETSRLAVLLTIMIGSALLSLGLQSLTSYVSVRISIHVHNDMQAQVFSSVLDADWQQLSRFSAGDLLNRLNSDVNTVASHAVSWLPDLAVGVYTFAATFFVIWHYDHVMALLALASAPFLLFSSRRLLRRMREHNQTMKELGSDLVACESEAFHNLDTIKSLALTGRYTDRLLHRQADYRDASLRYNRFSIRMKAVLSLLGTAVQMVTFCYCLYLLWSGRIVYGTMTLFLSQGTRLSSTFSSLVGLLPGFLTGSVSAHRIRELQQMQKETVLEESDALLQEADRGLRVCAENVSFSYSERTVLAGCDFRADPGEIVALVGPSGEGKTTMIRLMLGLVQPDAGAVTLQTASGLRVNANAGTRRCFSYVPQGNTVLSGTVAENLRLVKPDASDEELEQALRMACAWDFVSALPDGLNSSLGERGRGFSEGQSQRLAIARAVLRGAPVLLLDEATSALDVATERRVLRNIMQQAPSRTCILTTHRPSVLSLCQRVYQVSESGLRELSPEESARAAMDF